SCDLTNLSRADPPKYQARKVHYDAGAATQYLPWPSRGDSNEYGLLRAAGPRYDPWWRRRIHRAYPSAFAGRTRSRLYNLREYHNDSRLRSRPICRLHRDFSGEYETGDR